ncbi:tetratricopeptide repeat protein [Chryseolinea lacunae]|uniref:histidine kinase n=1 Tax=Chryseolinea lacunae TaxID=2801331 RepID=A0ABS1L1P0_9BACT|nr:tetratricopeptide repeat protein [Chryseolinea lacunae]MBL0745448.1 tetratricopeptide repeat protein [Chryseolinea lacunae]
MRLLFISFALGWLVPMFALAQTSRITDLESKLSRAESPEQKAEILHELASATWDYDFEKAYGYAQKAWLLSRQNQYVKGQVQALTDIGLYHYFSGNYTQASARYHEAVRLCGSHRYGAYPAYTLTRLGNLCRVQAKFDSARYFYDASLKLLADMKSPGALSSVYYNKGALALSLSAFDSALVFFRQSEAIRKQSDTLNLMECWHGIGQAHQGAARFDSALYFYDKAFRMALRHKDREQQMVYYTHRGEIYTIRGDYKNAIRDFSQALDILSRHRFKRYHALVLRHIAEVYDAQGDFRRANEHFLTALRMQEAMNNKQEIGKLYGDLAWLYIHERNDSVASQYAANTLRVMEEIGDKSGISFAHNVLGFIHYSHRRMDEALEHYQKALALRKEIKAMQLYSGTMFNIARVYEKQGAYARAREYLVQALALDERSNDLPGLVMTYNALGALSSKTKLAADAEQYLNKAQALARQIGARSELRNNYKIFADHYRAKGDLTQALVFYDRYIALNDSIFTRQNASKIAEMNALYELEKKEREIQSLNQQNEVSQNEIQLQKTQLSLQRSYLTFTIAGLALLGLMAYMFFLNARLKNKANRDLKRFNTEVQEQKEEIQAQSEELTEANNSLMLLNNELVEKTEEVQAQAEELRESNEMITEINRDLDQIVTKRTFELQEAFKELDTFFYRSSHDFRRPLTTFMGLAEVAKITLKDPVALELFAKVNETAFSLDKMLLKLQSISDVGAQQLIFREVWIREIYESVCTTFREDLQRLKIGVHAQVNLQTSFISYPVMVRIIIENLVENAIHFCTPEDPYIFLRARQEGDNAVIEVEDNGQGIDEHYSDKIFDMYFRASERSKGNGLGLYIVKKAVKKLNGSLELVTKVGKGSRFIITLPMNKSTIHKF